MLFARWAWITLCLALALAPHVRALPLWITVTVAVAAGIRLLLAWRSSALLPAVLRIGVALAAVALLFFQFHTFNGIDAGRALLALMAGLKLLEARAERDAQIIVFIVYFLCITALLEGTSFPLVVYVLAVCWITTAALARMTRVRPGPSIKESAALAARLLLVASPLALALWLFFPRFGGPLWSLPESQSAAQSGLGDRMSPGDLSELSLSDEVAFRVRFKGKAPPPSARYWRGPVLFDFDGRAWSRRDLSFALTSSLVPSGDAVDYVLSLEPHHRRSLLALDLPLAWDAPHSFLTSEYSLMQAEPVTRAMDIKVHSDPRARISGALSLTMRRRDTRLPPQSNPRTRALAANLRATYADDQDYARAVLAMFHDEPFFYTLTPPQLGRDAVDEFLFQSKRGFCEHYASAFAALMRAGGIPARVITGYQGGTYNRFTGSWIVRQSDAHAWNELWIEGRGWVRADPTAAIAPERNETGTGDVAGTLPALNRWAQASPWLADLRLRVDAVRQWWREAIVRFDQDSQMSLLRRLGIKTPDAHDLVAVLGAALLLCLVWLALLLRSSGRPRSDAIREAFERMSAKLGKIGLARRPCEPALTYAARITRARADLGPAITALCARYNALRYDTSSPSSTQVQEFIAAVRTLKVRPESNY